MLGRMTAGGRRLSVEAGARLIEPRDAVLCGFAAGHEAARLWVQAVARPGDTVLVMGARDPDLPALARSIFDSLSAA